MMTNGDSLPKTDKLSKTKKINQLINKVEMKDFSKKAVAASLSVATAAWLSGAAMLVPVAGAATTAELQAQIAALLAQITALQAQLGTSASTYSFTRSLTIGSTGADVKALQQWLNANGYAVSATGVGSAGNESTYFGAKTKAALAKYQAAKGISPAVGYFGPVTRASLASVTTTTTTTTTTTATSTNTGVESSMTVKLAPLPGDLTEVKEGQSDIAGVAYEVKATNNQLTLNRLDLNFNKRPWLSFSNISVWDGSTKLAETGPLSSASFNEITASTDYQLRLSGLNLVVDKDQTKTITVKFSSPVKTESGSVNVNVTAKAQSFRGTDPLGKTQDGPTGDLAARTVKFLAKTAADLELSQDTNNPKDRYVQVSLTDTTEVELLRVKLKATNSDAKLSTLNVGYTATTSVGVTTIIDGLRLYVDSGTTAVAAASAAAATSSFTSLEDKVGVIAKDTTKTLSIRAIVKKKTGNYGAGEVLSAAINANTTDIVGVDAVSFADATVSGSNIAGKKARFSDKVPSFSLVSATITPKQTTGSNTTKTDRAESKIRVAVKALGGDIYIGNDNATVASSGLAGSSTTPNGQASSVVAAVADSLNSNNTVAELKTNSWLVPNGQTKVFEVSSQMNVPVGSTAGFYQGYVNRALWATTDTIDIIGGGATTTVAGAAGFATNTGSPGDYVSPKAYLEVGFIP